jgi:radical SAM-linked protein
VSFSPALPLGTESEAEFLFVDLKKPLTHCGEWLLQLNEQLPEGLSIQAIGQCSKISIPAKIESTYEIGLQREVRQAEIDNFFQNETFMVDVIRKKKRRQIDARDQVIDLSMYDNDIIQLVTTSETGKAALKPMEIVSALFGLNPEETTQARVLKTKSRSLKGSKNGANNE